VAHRQFVERPLEHIVDKLLPQGIYVDVKSQADASRLAAKGIDVWRL